jgi:hypothetical protein
MTAAYRLVTYIPDPFVPVPYPVGAVVRDGNQVSTVRVARAPSFHALGSRRRALMCQDLIEDLANIKRFDSLPESFGLHAALGPEQALPKGIRNPAEWVSIHILNRKVDNGGFRTDQAKQRRTQGYEALMKAIVREHVPRSWIEKTLKSSDRPAWMSNWGEMPEVSHFVARGQRMLLMEPLVLNRQGLDEEIGQVVATMGLYRLAAIRRKAENFVQTAIYVSGDYTDPEELQERLAAADTPVFQLAAERDVADLAGRMRWAHTEAEAK